MSHAGKAREKDGDGSGMVYAARLIAKHKAAAATRGLVPVPGQLAEKSFDVDAAFGRCFHKDCCSHV